MDRATLAVALAAHEPVDDVEAGHVASVLALLADSTEPFGRAREEPGHVTASAFVLSEDGERVLLVHHEALGRWLQPGGHVELGDADIVAAARREVEEETGLRDLVLAPGWPELLDVDVHDIPARESRGEGPHQHFDVRVALQVAHEAAAEARAGEGTLDVRWVALDEVGSLDVDASVLRAVARLRARRVDRGDATHAPSTARNREPLEAVLREVCAPGDRVLEVASGSGEHAAWLAPRLGVRWQPSEREAAGRRVVHAQTIDVAGVAAPVAIDASRPPWASVRGAGFDVVFCANMVHISPWAVTQGLVEGAADVLADGGRLVLYGPYRVLGAHTAPSNERFDQSLRGRDPQWGVRDLEAVVAEAAQHGLVWQRTVQMPANNLTVIFERRVAVPAQARAVLEHWFGSSGAPGAEQQTRWWTKDPARDEAVRREFGDLHEHAVAGELDGWARTPRGRLALIVLLDQLSREIHRDTPGMFAADDAALRWCVDGLRRGHHRELTWHERLFFQMPLMHAEDRRIQQLSVAAFRSLADEAATQGVDLYGNVDYAQRHRAIVMRFGRYLHRNAILGRTSTPEEQAFLREPGSSF